VSNRASAGISRGSGANEHRCDEGEYNCSVEMHAYRSRRRTRCHGGAAV